MSSILWIAMEQHTSSLDTGKGMFSDLLSEICMASPAMLDRMERSTRDALADGDINPRERDDLLCLLDARRRGDEEAMRSILLKYNPQLLLDNERVQAAAEHRFRVANHCAHRCKNLRTNTHDKCEKCAREPGTDCLEPDKICPAREATKGALEPAEMVA